MAKNAEDILRQMLTTAHMPAVNMEAFIDELKQRIAHECGQIDGKFCGLIWRRRDGQVEEQFVVFVPRDRFLPMTLRQYLYTCQSACPGGAGDPQSQAVERLIERVEEWQQTNPDLIKTPDAAPGECP